MFSTILDDLGSLPETTPTENGKAFAKGIRLI